MASGSLASLRWLFRLTLKLFSDFPTYFCLHKVHSIRLNNVSTRAIDIVEHCVRFIVQGCWIDHLFATVSYCGLNTVIIYHFSLSWCLFSRCCTRCCCCRLVPWNFCCVWKLLLIYFEKCLCIVYWLMKCFKFTVNFGNIR